MKGNMALDKAKLVEELSNATVLEIADLVKELEAKWGVTAAAPVAVAAPSGPGGPAAPAAPDSLTRVEPILDKKAVTAQPLMMVEVRQVRFERSALALCRFIRK